MNAYIYISPVRVNPVKTIPISKSPLKLASLVEIPAIMVSSTGFSSFDRVFSSGELLDRDRSKPSIYNYTYGIY